jgi:tetratricopeptide (TPR) repeat protein
MSSLGDAYLMLPGSERTENMLQALECFREGLRFVNESSAPNIYALLQSQLGCVFLQLPGESSQENLRNAITCFETSLRFYTPAISTNGYADARNNLGKAYAELTTGNLQENRLSGNRRDSATYRGQPANRR